MELIRAIMGVSALSLLWTTNLWAFSSFAPKVPNLSSSCNTCHSVSDWSPRNVFGQSFDDNGFIWNAALADADSDGDGQSNGEELGDPCGIWSQGDPESPRSTNISAPGDENSTSSDPMGGSLLWYQDADSDGAGNPEMTQQACEQPIGYVDVAGDCDDADETATTICDEIDDAGNSDGSSNETDAGSGGDSSTESDAGDSDGSSSETDTGSGEDSSSETDAGSEAEDAGILTSSTDGTTDGLLCCSPETEEEDGCGCNIQGNGGAAGYLLGSLFLLGLALRRRK